MAQAASAKSGSRKNCAAKLGRVLSTLLGGADRNSRAFVGEMGALLDGPRGVLVAYGERDIGPVAEFEEHFGKIVPRRARDRCYLLVPGGDHTYTARAAQQYVISETLDWLTDRYGLRARPGTAPGSVRPSAPP